MIDVYVIVVGIEGDRVDELASKLHRRAFSRDRGPIEERVAVHRRYGGRRRQREDDPAGGAGGRQPGVVLLADGVRRQRVVAPCVEHDGGDAGVQRDGQPAAAPGRPGRPAAERRRRHGDRRRAPLQRHVRQAVRPPGGEPDGAGGGRRGVRRPAQRDDADDLRRGRRRHPHDGRVGRRGARHGDTDDGRRQVAEGGQRTGQQQLHRAEGGADGRHRSAGVQSTVYISPRK